MSEPINHPGTRGPIPQPLTERFWARVKKTSECWEWLGSRTPAGYGHLGVGSAADGTRRTVYAHRLSYELAFGPIPDTLSIDHLCKNTVCVRPDHLEVVPVGVNALRGDGPAARNRRKTHCKRGHPFDADNTLWRADGKGRECRACRVLRKR